MYPFIFGQMASYSLFVGMGTVIGILAFLCVFYHTTKEWRTTLLNLLVCILVITVASKAAEILYALNTQEYDGIKGLLFERSGSHFLGRVLFASWVFPPLYRGLHRLFGNKISWRYHDMLDAVSFYFVTQHFFNRIACWCNGCCSGKRYFGFGAVSYQDVGSVYPSQLMEAFFMIVILIVLLRFKQRYRPLFGWMLLLFGFAIFISEFWMDQTGILLIVGLNIVQYAGILCMLTGVIYIVHAKSIKKQREGRLR